MRVLFDCKDMTIQGSVENMIIEGNNYGMTAWDDVRCVIVGGDNANTLV